uniref:Uncharacterized protein n=1 Tax=Aegilops tauschii subsp. strangulata TaxID=200361 RepID=A0A453LU90_AEGTS
MPCGGLPQPQQRSRNLQQHLRHPPNELEVGNVVHDGLTTTTRYALRSLPVRLESTRPHNLQCFTIWSASCSLIRL